MIVNSAVIFGAGKIARGFIAHLLTLSGYHLTFVERAATLVALLRERQLYRVGIMGRPERDIVIQGFEVLSTGELSAVAAAVARASVVFVSVGGPNLPQVAPLLAEGVRRAHKTGRVQPLNVVLCENYFQPAQWLRQLVAEELSSDEAGWFSGNVGIVETMVLRSTIEPSEAERVLDPLFLRAQDMWELFADKSAFVGAPPSIEGLRLQDNFQGSLVRKLFTYNAINAVLAYTGYLKGHTLLSDAANDGALLQLARDASQEASLALCVKYGFGPEDQRAFAESAIAKYQKVEIVDPIERNARDPIRKLGRHDRLVGPACLALECGVQPKALSRAIAAAFHYDHPADPSALRLQGLIRNLGLPAVLQQVCEIDPNGELALQVIQAF